MQDAGYDYHGLLASTWDLARGDTSNWSDRHLFVDLIRRFGEPVLDIGCGTGRILLDLRALGMDAEGVDNSPEFLDLCRAKATAQNIEVEVYEQRMEELDLPRRFRTILAPSSALQLLTDPPVFREALRRFFDHLLPGGALVASFAFEWRPGDPLDTGWELLFDKTRPEDGATVRSWTREWRDPEARLWHTEQRFEVELEGEVVQTEFHRRSPEGRWYGQIEVREVFAEAGFTDVRLLHEFTHEPARPDDRLFCAVAVRSSI
ncbi:MAG: class I SAM-dependent methyltransferase [Fimbriimonadaceae bacterium]|nr:class I SAM-dependent methyltransferase [Fimbriimonadaceae bacterium]